MVYNRNIRFRVDQAIKVYPIVALCGARKTGKTTFAKQLAEQKMYNYVNFADIRNVIAAQDNPVEFLNKCEKPVIFDEVQRVPELFVAIKQYIERHQMPGRYLLIVSIDLMQQRACMDLLAQYTHILPFYPLSQGELSHTFDTCVDALFSKKSLIDRSYVAHTCEELFTRMIMGGFPAVQDMADVQIYGWFNNYITSIIQNESSRIMHIEGISTIARLLLVLATYASDTANGAQMSRDMGIPISTLNRYVDMLNQLNIHYYQSALREIIRCAKSPKFYLVDTGLLAWLLKTSTDTIQNNDRYMQNMMHNFVFNELQKQISWNNTLVHLYHMRMVNGISVDFVLQRSDGVLVGVVIKNSTNITHKDLKGLLHLKEYAGNNFYRGIVLYPGEIALPLAPSICALPISALWHLSKDS